MSRRTCEELGVCQARSGCSCSRYEQHDTEAMPPGGYYFAPGAIESGPHRRKRLAGWRRLVLDVAACLAVAGLIGFAAGVLQAKGWPL